MRQTLLTLKTLIYFQMLNIGAIVWGATFLALTANNSYVNPIGNVLATVAVTLSILTVPTLNWAISEHIELYADERKGKDEQ